MKPTTPSIPEAYLQGEAALRPFYQYDPCQPDFAQIMADKGREAVDRALLQRVIREQYEGLEMGTAVEQHLEWLGETQSFTLTTGHQLVLMGGPLFTVYKVLSVIKLAAQLRAQHPEHKVLPVFWIHTEDHDFEEVNHCFAAYDDKRVYPGNFQGAVGTHEIEAEIETLLADWPETWRACYAPGRSWAYAFRCLMHQLFGKYGLLILDAAHPALKARFREVLQAEIAEPVTEQLVQDYSVALVKAGFSQQITPRPVNLFYLDAAGRDRLVRANGQVGIKGRNQLFSAQEIKALIEAHPERFSPNVSLRPLYQEMILPNLAYVGGWGELSYWMQLKGVFDHFGVNFPLLLPRMSATVVTAEQKAAWEALGFSLPDLKRPLSALYTQYLPQVWDDDEFSRLEGEILQQIAALRDHIEGALSPTLARSGEALRAKTAHYLLNLRKKAARVVRHQQPESFARIRALKWAVQPDGLVQERVWSLAAVPDTDPEAFIDLAWEACEPLDFSHRFLVVGEEK